MIYIIDCGFQSVTAARLKSALSAQGFTSVTVEPADPNEYRVEMAEVVKPNELAALLDRDFERHKPLGKEFMDPIRLTLVEEGNNEAN